MLPCALLTNHALTRIQQLDLPSVLCELSPHSKASPSCTLLLDSTAGDLRSVL